MKKAIQHIIPFFAIIALNACGTEQAIELANEVQDDIQQEAESITEELEESITITFDRFNPPRGIVFSSEQPESQQDDEAYDLLLDGCRGGNTARGEDVSFCQVESRDEAMALGGDISGCAWSDQLFVEPSVSVVSVANDYFLLTVNNADGGDEYSSELTLTIEPLRQLRCAFGVQ